ncbi:hypothetical protein V1478_004772 [Vespula squamosa]|uniref:Uncharacterized protein n=1 Tax=Vespula squamosa TaxID=30214 RepID=A0ABD2BEN8_VESSQ
MEEEEVVVVVVVEKKEEEEDEDEDEDEDEEEEEKEGRGQKVEEETAGKQQAEPWSRESGGNGGDGGGVGGLREQSALDACSKTTKAELIKRESVVVPPVTPTENSDRVGLIIAGSSPPRLAGQ